MTAFIHASVFLLAACVGSFLNVCIYRMPRDLSVVKPRSFCPACAQPIPWYCNIPVLSWLMLRGRCIRCGEPIALRYPFVEAVTGAAGVACAATWPPVEAVVNFAFLSALIVITAVDIEFQVIPSFLHLPDAWADRIVKRHPASEKLVSFAYSVPEMAAAAGCAWLVRGRTPAEIAVAFAAGAAVFLVIGAVYKLLSGREGIGFGDVKLMALFGAFFGNWQSIPFIVMIGSVAGTFIGLGLMLFCGRDSKHAVPFGPFLALAATVYLFAGDRIIRWYFGLL